MSSWDRKSVSAGILARWKYAEVIKDEEKTREKAIESKEIS